MDREPPVLNAIRRLPFGDLPPRLQNLLRPRVERLGYLGEFFQCAANQPDVLAPFIEMTAALKEALPDRLTEVGALTIACLAGNDYERHQHERLSRKLGFGEAWVLEVERLDPDHALGMADVERTVQRLILAAVKHSGKNLGGELDAVTAAIGAEQTIAILFLIGRYLTHAIVVNALGLAPPVPSIFAEDGHT